MEERHRGRCYNDRWYQKRNFEIDRKGSVTFKPSHCPLFSRMGTRRCCIASTKPEIFSKSGVRASITWAESFADLQTCYERLWQSPSSNDKQDQRNNQNDVDDRRFQQFLFRV